jgi:hypothetical protein
MEAVKESKGRETEGEKELCIVTVLIGTPQRGVS